MNILVKYPLYLFIAPTAWCRYHKENCLCKIQMQWDFLLKYISVLWNIWVLFFIYFVKSWVGGVKHDNIAYERLFISITTLTIQPVYRYRVFHHKGTMYWCYMYTVDIHYVHEIVQGRHKRDLNYQTSTIVYVIINFGVIYFCSISHKHLVRFDYSLNTQFCTIQF